MNGKVYLVYKSNNKSNDNGVHLDHRSSHSVPIRNNSRLNQVCYHLSDIKHQASGVVCVSAGGSAGKCEVKT